jgi:hypothetical protein
MPSYSGGRPSPVAKKLSDPAGPGGTTGRFSTPPTEEGSALPTGRARRPSRPAGRCDRDGAQDNVGRPHPRHGTRGDKAAALLWSGPAGPRWRVAKPNMGCHPSLWAGRPCSTRRHVHLNTAQRALSACSTIQFCPNHLQRRRGVGRRPVRGPTSLSRCPGEPGDGFAVTCNRSRAQAFVSGLGSLASGSWRGWRDRLTCPAG